MKGIEIAKKENIKKSLEAEFGEVNFLLGELRRELKSSRPLSTVRKYCTIREVVGALYSAYTIINTDSHSMSDKELKGYLKRHARGQARLVGIIN